MAFYINLDISPFLEIQSEFDGAIKDALAKATSALAAQTHGKIVEFARKELHSTRQKYVDALTYMPVNSYTWVVNLDRKMLWLEDGLEPNREMIEDLLSSPKAKTGKDGSKYLSVPFEHKKGETQQTPGATSLTDTIKAEFKKAKIPYGKIENGKDGKPMLGLLHKIDINHAPLKTVGNPWYSGTRPGLGQGSGPIGSVMQGPTGIPLLQGVRVYQKEFTDKDGAKRVGRSIVTFRMVSSKMMGTGRWTHPGIEAKKFLDKAYEWAMKEWETKVRDEVLDSIGSL
jgi:hypothetical protein